MQKLILFYFIVSRIRQRSETNLTQEEDEKRALLMKQWSGYRLQQHRADIRMLDRIQYSQQRALDKLREESEELYQAAIQVSSPSLCAIVLSFIIFSCHYYYYIIYNYYRLMKT